MIRKRENSININAALCSETKLLHYTTEGGGQIQGFIEFMSPLFLKQYHPLLYKNATKLQNLPTVPCVQLSRLVNQLNIFHIDIWILDVEGAELSVLQGTNFNLVDIDTVVVECDGSNSTKDNEKREILKNNRYICEQVSF